MACPICLGEANSYPAVGADGGARAATHCDCERCGEFTITRALSQWWADVRKRNGGQLDAPTDSLVPYLSAHTRQSHERIELTTGNWQGFAQAHMRTPFSQKRDRLLRLIAERSNVPGDWVPIDARLTTPLLDVKDTEELQFLLGDLFQRGFLRGQEFATGHELQTTTRYGLTSRAWEALEPIAGGGIVGTCFVAMWFDAETDKAYDEGIRPAIEDDCGLRAQRVDREEYNDDITDRILAGIRSAQCVVADFTGQRQGVYFEAGFALGLGREVIWTCRADDVERLHFDTNHRKHVVWNDPADLRRKLSARIKATVTLPVRFQHN